MGWSTAIAAALLGLGLAAGHGGSKAGAASDPVFGYWLSEGHRAIVRVQPCGDEACGRIVWLAEPQTDRQNHRESLRDRALCGLELIGGFDRAAPGVWKHGYVYNPEDGRTYTARMAVQGPDTLELRGYVMLPLLGRSRVWTREPDDRGGCPAAQPPARRGSAAMSAGQAR